MDLCDQIDLVKKKPFGKKKIIIKSFLERFVIDDQRDGNKKAFPIHKEGKAEEKR
ncbi:MAG TPA: hypothetical protein H9687_02240 [Firmicutes bacterium]|nr:hypothetical protein [Bacillota bacterium]